MIFLSLIAALFLEQARPLRHGNKIYYFTQIMPALRGGQPTVGRDCLHAWSDEAAAELDANEFADVSFMQTAVSLIWRTLVPWMVLILLATIAHALG